jgi:hypothetical protein
MPCMQSAPQASQDVTLANLYADVLSTFAAAADKQITVAQGHAGVGPCCQSHGDSCTKM